MRIDAGGQQIAGEIRQDQTGVHNAQQLRCLVAVSVLGGKHRQAQQDAQRAVRDLIEVIGARDADGLALPRRLQRLPGDRWLARVAAAQHFIALVWPDGRHLKVERRLSSFGLRIGLCNPRQTQGLQSVQSHLRQRMVRLLGKQLLAFVRFALQRQRHLLQHFPVRLQPLLQHLHGLLGTAVQPLPGPVLHIAVYQPAAQCSAAHTQSQRRESEPETACLQR